MNQKFPKTEKLKQYAHITSLFANGKGLKSYPLKLVYEKVDAPVHKAGVSVSKRQFKKAVDRNRLKRQIREAYRLNKHLIRSTPNKYSFMFIYLSREKMTYDKIEKAVQKILRELAEL